jgi:hypothetical protein
MSFTELIELIKNSLNDVASVAVTRERLLLFRDLAELKEKENVELKGEVARLAKEVAELRKQIEKLGVRDNFVEKKGVLFKRKPAGGYVETPYCYKCRVPYGQLAPSPVLAFACFTCGQFSTFPAGDVPGLIKELESEDSSRRG